MSPSDRFVWDEGDVNAFDSLEDALAAREQLAARLRDRFGGKSS